MAGVRDDEERGRADLPLHEDPGLQARLVLVARDDQRRHLEPREPILEVEDRRAEHLHPPHRQGVPLGRLGGEPVAELLPPSGILPEKLNARRPARVGLRDLLHPLRFQPPSQVRRVLLELVPVGAAPIAAPRHRERQRAIRIAEPEVERGVAAHGEPADVGLRDLQVIQESPDVFHGLLLGEGRGIVGNVRRRVSARVERDRAVAPAEEVDLGAPAEGLAGELVDEDERRPLADHLVEQIDAVDQCLGHSGWGHRQDWSVWPAPEAVKGGPVPGGRFGLAG